MNLKVILFVVGLALLIATFFIDARLAPVVGAALLLGAIVYGWVANKTASKANYDRAERATRQQKASGYHDK
ncbi:MAG: hypothetical protein V2J51_05170 [Erythrobacter sp.]|jgi:Ca2+/Na+ antiporter|nr:hypothetical protein [Erythrobacter sp.]